MNIMEWTTEVGCAYTASFSIGTIGSSMSCTIQLKDFAGNNLAVKNAIVIYFSTDVDGLETATVTSCVLATHGIIYTIESLKAYQLITEANGIAAVTIDNSSAADLYVNVVLPNGKVVTSSVMAFNG